MSKGQEERVDAGKALGLRGRLGLAATLACGLLAFASPAWAAEFRVNKEADTNDGTCAPGDCSLREAIVAANILPGADIVNVPAGTYRLSRSGTGENLATTGDLDIIGVASPAVNGLILTGAGARSTTVDGGGIDRVFDVQAQATAEISGLTITGGQVSGDFTFGGGVQNQGTLTLRRAAVTGNTSEYAFGGVATFDLAGLPGDPGGLVPTPGGLLPESGQQPSSTRIFDSVISDNTAEAGGGGGLGQEFGATVEVVNTTVSGNTAGVRFGGGGGVAAYNNKTLTLRNSTVNDNSARSGASNLVSFQTATTVKNSIVANPSGGGGNCGTLAGGGATPIASQGGNLEFPTTSCGFTGSGDIQNQDPLLGPLANNGGPTDTHALLSGSPAIDAADNTACPATDQRGISRRPQDGDTDGTAVCDIGAFELAATPPPVSPPPVGPPPVGSTPPPVRGQSCTITRGAGNDVIRGTPGNDVICAGAGNDVVYGGGGNDAILGQGGNDALRGQAGNDRLSGGPGNDSLVGGPGNDTLTGSSGNDSLVGGPGNDSANGGPGNDSCPADRRDARRSC